MKWLRWLGVAAIALGILLLIVGIDISSDILGFVFMVLALVGVALLLADFLTRRRGHTPV
jgi:drug/metabolite transporter (DMT)-like permease